MLDWPLAELLLAFEARTVAQAESTYLEEVRLWAALAPYAEKQLTPPQYPNILKEIRSNAHRAI